MCICVNEIFSEGIFVSFPWPSWWWLENMLVKNIAPIFKRAPICFPKWNNYIFKKKIIYTTHKKDSFECDNYILSGERLFTVNITDSISLTVCILWGHSNLGVTGVLGRQLKTWGLLVRDYFFKGGHFVRRAKGVKRWV